MYVLITTHTSKRAHASRTLRCSGQSAQGKSIPVSVRGIESLSVRVCVCLQDFRALYWNVGGSRSVCYQMMMHFPEEKETPSLNKQQHTHTTFYIYIYTVHTHTHTHTHIQQNMYSFKYSFDKQWTPQQLLFNNHILNINNLYLKLLTY